MGLDTVELVIRTEEEFDIQIENSEAEQIITVNDLFECVAKKLSENSRLNVERDILLQQVIQIVSEQAGVDTEKIKPSSSFLDDLGMD